MLTAHNSLANLVEGYAVGRCSRFCIFAEILQIISHCEVEKRQAVIKNRSGLYDLSCVIVTQNTEVSEMSVLVVNHSIEHQHTAKIVIKLFAKPGVIIEGVF